MVQKVSPPFQGGVAGAVENQLFAKISSPAGVVDFFLITFMSMNNKNLFDGKVLKSFRPLRNRSISTYLKSKIRKPFNNKIDIDMII